MHIPVSAIPLTEGLAKITGLSTDPFVNFVSSSGDFSSHAGLHVDGTTGTGAVIIEGDTGAKLILGDSGGTVNSRIMEIEVDSDITTFRSLNDALTTNIIDILVLEHSTGNIGMGITTPDGALHVMTTTAGAVTAHADASIGVFESGASNGLSILVPDASTSLIMFGSPGSNRGAEINWVYDNDLMRVGTRKAGAALALMSGNAVDAITIDSNQKVGIGTATPTKLLHLLDTTDNVNLRIETNKVNGFATLEFVNDAQEWQFGVTDLDDFAITDSNGGVTPFVIRDGAPVNSLVLNATGAGFGTGPSVAFHIDSNAANTAAIQRWENTAGSFDLFRTDATPEAAVTSAIGGLTNDATNGDLYYKNTGAGNTGWLTIPPGIHAQAVDEDNTDAFVINVTAQAHSYHTNGLASGALIGAWTFDGGGAGTSVAISSIADGGGGEIAVTTGAAHGLAVGDIISQTNTSDAAYQGVFVVNTITSSTIYEVTAVFTSTDTGTMDQAATLTAGTGDAGDYFLSWDSSATSASNNETFDYEMRKNAAIISGSKVRRKFGTATDFGAWGKGTIVSIVAGDKISLSLMNNDTAANVTMRNLTYILHRIA